MNIFWFCYFELQNKNFEIFMFVQIFLSPRKEASGYVKQ